MFNELVELLEYSYAPYSKFKVASIIVDQNGKKYKGVNVESGVLSLTNCAERNAIQTFVTNSNNRKSNLLKEIHVLAKNKNSNPNLFTTPCGACRQLILEHSIKDVKIVIYDLEGNTKEMNMNDLLPNSFGVSELDD